MKKNIFEKKKSAAERARAAIKKKTQVSAAPFTVYDAVNGLEDGDKFTFRVKNNIEIEKILQKWLVFKPKTDYEVQVSGNLLIINHESILAKTRSEESKQEFIKTLKDSIPAGGELCADVVVCDKSFITLKGERSQSFTKVLSQGSLRPPEAAPEPEPEPVPAEPVDEPVADVPEEPGPEEAKIKAIYEYTDPQWTHFLIYSEGKEGSILKVYNNFFGNKEVGWLGDYIKSPDAILRQSTQIRMLQVRVAFGFEGPKKNLGSSAEQWKKINVLQARVKELTKERHGELAKSLIDVYATPGEGYDEYGIPLPTLELEYFSKPEIRKKQYKNYTLIQIFQDINIGAEKFKEEEEEATPVELPFIDPEDPLNDFRVGVSGEPGDCNGPCTPALKIRWKDTDPEDGIPDDNFGYFEYGENDPLGRRERKRYSNINEFTKRHFNGKTFVEYWKDNQADIIKDVVLKRADGSIERGRIQPGSVQKGDIVLSSPNFWPFHVALAAEEFHTNMKNSQARSAGEYQCILYFESEGEIRRAQEAAKDLGRVLDFPLYVVPPEIEKILGKRIAYFGMASTSTYKGRNYPNLTGLFDIAARNPIFGISNKAEEYIKAISDYYKGMSEMEGSESSFVTGLDKAIRDPGGNKLYMNYERKPGTGDKRLISISNKNLQEKGGVEGKFYISEEYSLQSIFEGARGGPTHMVEKPPEKYVMSTGEEKEYSLGRIFIIPKDSGEAFTDSEKILARRLGLRLDQKYTMDLKSAKTNFGGMIEYGEGENALVTPGSLGAGPEAGAPSRGGAPSNEEVDGLLVRIKRIFKLKHHEEGKTLYEVEDISDIPDEGPTSIVLDDVDETEITIKILPHILPGMIAEANAMKEEFEETFEKTTKRFYNIIKEIDKIKAFEKQIKKRYPKSIDPTLNIDSEDLTDAFKKIHTDAKKGDKEAGDAWVRISRLRGAIFDDEGIIIRPEDGLTRWGDMTQETREEILQLLGISIAAAPAVQEPADDPTLKTDPEVRKAAYFKIRELRDEGDLEAQKIIGRIFELRGGRILDDGSGELPEDGLASWEDMSQETREKILQLLKYAHPKVEEPLLPTEKRKVWRYMTRDEGGVVGLTEFKSAEEITEDIKNKIVTKDTTLYLGPEHEITRARKLKAGDEKAFKDVFRKIEKPEAEEETVQGTTLEKRIKEFKPLIFGHSQTGRFAKSLIKKIEQKGGKAPKVYTYGNQADGKVGDKPGLASLIKSVKNKYTHAYLFLNGNSKESLFEKEKKFIVNYVIDELGVKKENILVILPPKYTGNPKEYNLEDTKKLIGNEKRWLSKEENAGKTKKEYNTALNRRLKQLQRAAIRSYLLGLNKRAEEIFISLGVEVLPQISSNDKTDFTDGMHLNATSELAVNTGGLLLSRFVSEEEPVEEETIDLLPEKCDACPESPQMVYNYLTDEHNVPHAHAVGMLVNIHFESRFNPTIAGKGGHALGLFQHEKSRRRRLEAQIGMPENFSTLSVDERKDFLRESWKGQVDYTMTESVTKKYLKQDFSKSVSYKKIEYNPISGGYEALDPRTLSFKGASDEARATFWFTYYWERPKNKSVKARGRADQAAVMLKRLNAKSAGGPVSPEQASESPIFEQHKVNIGSIFELIDEAFQEL